MEKLARRAVIGMGWFVGYTSNLATAVWMAHVHKETLHKGQQTIGITNYLPMPGATGGVICAPVWTRYMKTALAVQKQVDQAHHLVYTYVTQPKKINFLPTCKHSRGTHL